MSKLIDYREKLNLTQEDLSKKSGISVRTIQRIEAGTDPKGHTIKALANALKIEESELLEKKEIIEEINYNLLKIINLSSLLFVFIPPINIVLPLIIMFAKKQFNPLTKQIVSIQILWTILIIAIFMISSIFFYWFHVGNNLAMSILILLALGNVFIILRNTAEIDRNKRLYIKLNFSII